VKLEIWHAALVALGGGIGRLLSLRPSNRRIDAEARRTDAEAHQKDAESAEVLARAYALLIRDLREDLSRQDRELESLRKELRSVVSSRDAQIADLRSELAEERAENSRLRVRVVALESQVERLRGDAAA
jgi:chromosome segregation ATPase